MIPEKLLGAVSHQNLIRIIALGAIKVNARALIDTRLLTAASPQPAKNHQVQIIMVPTKKVTVSAPEGQKPIRDYQTKVFQTHRVQIQLCFYNQ